MEMEASTSPSSSPTDLSTGKKMGGRKTTRHPLYRGVRRRSSGKWASEVREPSKRSRIWLGTFPNPEMAAVAHDAAVVALHGDGAVQVQLNFPGSAHRLPRVACTSPAVADIQRVALQAARDFINAPASSSTLFSHNNNNKEEEGGGGEVEFVDEEAMFNMPLLVDGMAEGMLLTPPAMKKGFNWTQMEEEDLDDDVELDFSIWGWGWGD